MEPPSYPNGLPSSRLTKKHLLLVAFSLIAFPVRADDAISINADFPGGNINVTAIEEGQVRLEPDLRGDRPWFYWYFEVKVKQVGTVKFIFPDKIAGFKNGAIGYQGPATSKDGGETWTWMGTEQVDGSSFTYHFARTNERVRFAVTIPYVDKELDAFLKKHAENPHLKTSILTRSRKGRDVDLLQIGKLTEKKRKVLITARHHSSETIASYVFEGFLEEAMSDSAEGKKFRENYLLFAVPFVDQDGVAEGDQGKNRKPHDHNRDYGTESIYPEIQAIRKLDKAQDFAFALDFHCPTLVMKDHQVMYFVGPKNMPKSNFENVSEFARLIKKNLPPGAPAGPMVWLRNVIKPSPMNSHYFGFKKGAVMAATLEIPFSPPGKAADPESFRKYGQVILRAWVETKFLSNPTPSETISQKPGKQ